MKIGVLSGSLPIGYCKNCITYFKRGIRSDKQDYVISQQLPGRTSKCSVCSVRVRLYYPIPLRRS